MIAFDMRYQYNSDMTLSEFFDIAAALPRTVPKGCQLWVLDDHSPEDYVYKYIDGDLRTGSRLILARTLGRPIAEGMFACHHCDEKSCLNPEHIYEGTPAQNSADSVTRRRLKYGDEHWSRRNPEKLKYGAANHFSYNAPRGTDRALARLDEDKVRAIRREYAAGGTSQKRLADKYGVTQPTVGRVLRRACWGWVED